MSYPNEQTLKDFVAARLESVDEDGVSSHLETCADCSRRVEQLEQESDLHSEGIRAGLLHSPNVSSNDELASLMKMETPEMIEQHSSSRMPETIGPYKITGFLGRGGMGNVYKGIHPHLKREVAIKVIRDTRTDNPNAISRFRREMEAIGKLHHPNIVSAFDAGEVDGRPYIVMELLEGEDLAQYVAEHGPMSVEQACKTLEQAAKGLDYAHQAGLVHRDIKPSNLFRTKDGTIKLLDLGLARLLETEPDTPNRTETGVVGGTPEFMAPEQVGDFRNVDRRSDIYSLGCTFFYLLTGQGPFTGRNYARYVDKIAAHARDEVPALKQFRNDVPTSVEEVLRKMMEKKPEDRFQNASEIVFPTESSLLPSKTGTKYRGLLIGGAILSVCILLVILFGRPSNHQEASESNPSSTEHPIATAQVTPSPSETITKDEALENAPEKETVQTTAEPAPKDSVAVPPPATVRNVSLRTEEFAPLREAVKAKDIAAIRAFFEADPGLVHARYDYANTFLHYASFAAFPEFAEYLIGKGLDVNAINIQGQTPLHSAAYNAKSPEIVKTLLDNGANTEMVHGLGWTPLHCAASQNPNVEVAKCLIDKGSDINARDPDGKTPLHLAVRMPDENENIGVAKLLIEKGADINAKDKKGNTPLHDVAFNHKLDEAAKLLIENKADIEAKDEEGRTPLQSASRMFGNDKVRDVLIAAGADTTSTQKTIVLPVQIVPSGTSSYTVTETMPSGKKRTATSTSGGETQLVVILVSPGSVAAGLGLQADDIIVQYDNKEFSTTKEFVETRAKEPADGPEKELRVKRGEEILTFHVKPGLLGARLEERPKPMPKTGESDQKHDITTPPKVDSE